MTMAKLSDLSEILELLWGRVGLEVVFFWLLVSHAFHIQNPNSESMSTNDLVFLQEHLQLLADLVKTMEVRCFHSQDWLLLVFVFIYYFVLDIFQWSL